MQIMQSTYGVLLCGGCGVYTTFTACTHSFISTATDQLFVSETMSQKPFPQLALLVLTGETAHCSLGFAHCSLGFYILDDS